MKHIHLVLLTLTAGLAVLWALLFIAGRPAPALAAPYPGAVSGGLSGPVALPSLQTVITCNVTITTTDALPGINSFGTAANLANYYGLALAAGPPGPRVAEEDYFVLGTATPGFTYQVEATPDGAGNYNLGIVVYDATPTAIMTDSNTLDGNSAKVNLSASDSGPYYFKVFQISGYCTGGTYHLTVSTTSTPGADVYEPNNTLATAYRFPPGTSATAANANFYPVPDTDCYGFYVRGGQRYQAYTHGLSGVDTFIRLYERSGAEIASDDNGGGGFASTIEWTSAYNNDWYYVCITNLYPGSTSAHTYNLTISEIGAAATATPGPTATSVPGLDSCENNFDFDRACVIPGNQSLNFNFVSAGGGPDNDFFKIWVKPGLRFDCRTSDLSPGVDPNMIVYDQNRNGIGGNDDVSPGDYNSAFSYFATYEGWLYILVGTGNRTLPSLTNSNYTLRCDVVAPGTATPLPTNTPRPTAEPGVVQPTVEPPTATPPAGLTWRLLTTPPPPSGVATPSAPRFIPINLLVYYDANGDGQPGAGEGIVGVSAEAYDTSTGQMLAQGFTGTRGNLQFTVASAGPVRVSVPFFGFSQLVTSEGGAGIYLRVSP